MSAERIEELQWEIGGLLDFIENASLPLHSVNGSGIIIWANKAELDFLGYEKQEYVGKHISHFHVNEHVITDILTRLMNKETLRNYPAQLKCKNGEIKSVLINSNVLWHNNEFVHTRCFTRDVTEIRKSENEKMREFLELKKENNHLKMEIAQLKKSHLIPSAKK